MAATPGGLGANHGPMTRRRASIGAQGEVGQEVPVIFLLDRRGASVVKGTRGVRLQGLGSVVSVL